MTPTVIMESVSRKNETKCSNCNHVFWAWDSGREQCYQCQPLPETPDEKRIQDGRSEEELIRAADTALYAAKAAGRDRMLVWNPALAADQGPELLSLKVREAFATDGFTLVFQPVVRLSDGRVAYYESLVRMTAADGRVYSPMEFLPILERSGQMSRLTRRVVEVALWQLATVHGCSVSVNLSPSDLSDSTLLEDVEKSVANSVAPERLVFEIAEPTLLSNLAQGRRWMRRLGDLGCHFVLDDFGTGIGMFALLREDRVEQVKLSHMVVRALSAESGTRAFVIALREMIESQGKTAVATFLETEQLLGEFESAGFTHGQGYGIHEPSGDLRQLIEEFGSDL